ncbi:MAG: hypothetical protein AB7F64_05000 [Gammaproteobacteria bacterium]
MFAITITEEHQNTLTSLKNKFENELRQNPDAIPSELPDEFKQLTHRLLINITTQAVKEYQRWYNQNSAWYGIGLWNRHGQGGQEQAQKFKNDILRCTNLNEILKIVVDYFSDPKTRFDENSFSSYFLNALRTEPFLIELLNFGYLKNRYNTSIGYHDKLYDLEISRRAEPNGNKQSFTALTLLQNPPNPMSLIQLKTCFTKAYSAYLIECHRISFAQGYAVSYGTWTTFYFTVFAPFTYGITLIPAAASAGVAYWAATRRGVFTTHGNAGIKKASTLEIAIADSYYFDQIVDALKQYFSNKHGYGSRTNCNSHSYIAFLMEELRKNPDVVKTLNTHLFHPRGKTLDLKEQIIFVFSNRNLDLDSGYYHRNTEALKTAFDLFMSLSQEETASSTNRM